MGGDRLRGRAARQLTGRADSSYSLQDTIDPEPPREPSRMRIDPPLNSRSGVTLPLASSGPAYLPGFAFASVLSSLAAAWAVALPPYCENGTSRSNEAQYSSTSSIAYSVASS
jgi:hypothetical protein